MNWIYGKYDKILPPWILFLYLLLALCGWKLLEDDRFVFEFVVVLGNDKDWKRDRLLFFTKGQLVGLSLFDIEECVVGVGNDR